MANKIYLKSTFGYREDTLRNWQTANPVLQKGEISFVRDGYNGKFVKIGDGHTNWNNLPFAPLPKGEKGDCGEKGVDGKDGADYVLTVADKEEIANLIKPTADQTYSPASENAQSGKAVKEALESLANSTEKEWAVIEDITLTEAVMQINIPYSKLKGKKELHISAYIIPTDATVTNQEVSFGIGGKTYWTGKANAKAVGRILGVMDTYISPRRTVIFDGTVCGYDYTYSTTMGTSYKGVGYFRDVNMNDENYTDFASASVDFWMRTTSANPMAAGTRFKIWGR